MFTDLTFSRDGQNLVTTSKSGKTKIWDVDSGAFVRELTRDSKLTYIKHVNAGNDIILYDPNAGWSIQKSN
jgi:WD40 repeat protein